MSFSVGLPERCVTSFTVGLTRTVCSFVCDFIALQIMESVLTFHDDNFCKSRVLHACTGGACALETRRRFVTERGKKKTEHRILNPGLTAWVMSNSHFFKASVYKNCRTVNNCGMSSCEASRGRLVGRWSAVLFHRLAVIGSNPLQMINFRFFIIIFCWGWTAVGYIVYQDIAVVFLQFPLFMNKNKTFKACKFAQVVKVRTHVRRNGQA